MPEKSIVIVGAGMAGLSAGCYARLNGYKATILEMHNIPGGLCTAWKRRGYTFDISMHMVTGSKSGPFHRLWQELGVMADRRFHYHDEMCTVESGDKKLSYCTDAARLEEQMVALAPADAALSREFARLVGGADLTAAGSIEAPELVGPLAGAAMFLKVLPLLGKFRRYGRQTVQEFAARFSDPFLREAVRLFIDGPGWPMPRMPMIGMAGFLKSSVAEGGVPMGGSQQVAFTIAERFRKLGGDLRLRTRVTGVLVEGDRVAGVKLADGSELRSDETIWAADGHTLIFELLGGRYVDDRIRTMYEQWQPVLPVVQVCLGVARDLSGEPARVTFKLDEPIVVAGKEFPWLGVIHHSFDPAMAPPGKSAVEVWYACDYGYWEKLAGDRPRYEAEKQRIADQTIAALERRWPGFRGQVEVVDVATPATYKRYTGNWQGSPDGWYITPDSMRANPLRNLPGLKSLWMAGQWTAPFTGTIIAAVTGRQVIQLLCRQDRRRFSAAGTGTAA
jgi:phytoene dehydrogenase-like protein